MIIFLVGNNYEARSKELYNIIEKKHQEPRYLDGESTDVYVIYEQVYGNDLFDQEKIFIIHGGAHNLEVLERFFVDGPQHSVVFVDETHTAPTKKILKKYGADVREFMRPKVDDRSIFKITNSLVEFNPKNMWVDYHNLLDQGYSPYQIHGVLWWQIKSMGFIDQQPHTRLVKGFVANKIKRAQSQKNQPVKELSQNYLGMYADAYSEEDLRFGIERFILSLL